MYRTVERTNYSIATSKVSYNTTQKRANETMYIFCYNNQQFINWGYYNAVIT